MTEVPDAVAMPIRLENVSGRPVRLDLPSGRSLRLSPGQTSPPLAQADVDGSTRVSQLAAAGIVLVRDEASGAPPRKRASRAAGPDQDPADQSPADQSP